jgi:cobaltochelatase CobS
MSSTDSPVRSQVKTLVEDRIREQLLKNGANIPSPPVEEDEPAPVKPPVVLGEGQKLFTSLLGSSVEDDFAVSILDPARVPAEVRALIPDVNPLYKPDPAAMADLLRAWENKDTVLITGPTGAGKSEMVRHCCAITNRPFIRINMTEDAESSVIFGTLTARAGSTIWEDGPATEAVRYGGVLNVDEWDVTPPGVFMGFQWLLENNGRLFLKEMPGKASDKILEPHPQFRIVMNGNTVGQGDDTGSYAGTTVQNTAAIDRFQTTIKMDYMPANAEKDMLRHAVKGLRAKDAGNMVKFANFIRTAYKLQNINLTVSPRTLINWGNKYLQLGDLKKALSVAYLNKLRDNELKIATEAYTKVWGNA